MYVMLVFASTPVYVILLMLFWIVLSMMQFVEIVCMVEL